MISSTGEVTVWHSARHPGWTTLHCSLVTTTVMVMMVMIVRTTTTTMMVMILRTATMMMMVIAMWRWQTSAHFVTKNGTSFLSFNCNSFEPLSKIVPPPPQFLFFTHFLPFSPQFPFFTTVSPFHPHLTKFECLSPNWPRGVSNVFQSQRKVFLCREIQKPDQSNTTGNVFSLKIYQTAAQFSIKQLRTLRIIFRKLDL